MEQERKLKLELTWVNKDKPLKLETRLLIEDESKSYHACVKHGVNDQFENMLIHGDNLLALKALLPKYRGLVKCIYIDPPYNTGAAFEHYNDNMEHSTWLNLMQARINLLYELLSDDGFFCCQIDDSEGAYLKVLLDEIFGRENYQTTLYVRVRYPDKTLKEDMTFHKEIEQVFIYRKTYGTKPYLETKEVGYEKFIYEVKELCAPFKTIELGGKKVDVFAKDSYKIFKGEGNENGLKEVWATGTILDGNSSGRFFRDFLTGRYESDGLGILYKVYGIGDDKFGHRYFTGPQREGATKGKYYQGVPVDKLTSESIVKKIPIGGFYDFAANFGNCRQEGGVGFRGGKKPEIWLYTLLNYFTKPGDLVLDSFLGSGSTIAVAHKMGRRWIGIELGDHCYTHCEKRMRSVIDGSDQTGISKSVNWQGGGGYRFYELAPSLLKNVPYKVGDTEIIIPVIDEEKFDAVRLAQAVCVNVGYTYSPSETEYFIHGKSTENAFIYVTTDYMTEEHLNSISNALGDRSLLICCTGADTIPSNCKNISVKTIPAALLESCEWGRDNYSLNVQNLPENVDDDLNLFDDVEA